MKKFIIGATAALVATLSLASVADAGWRHHHRHHGWRHHGHFGIYFAPRVVEYDNYDADYCFTKKVKRYDDWGNRYWKYVRVCR